jgi:hypothetical protein
VADFNLVIDLMLTVMWVTVMSVTVIGGGMLSERSELNCFL